MRCRAIRVIRVVDIGSHLDKKIDAIAACKSQGGGNSGSLLRARLAEQGRSRPLPGNGEHAADREYVRQFLPDDYRQYGAAYDLTCAERFYHTDWPKPPNSEVDEYVENHAVQTG